MTRDEHLDWRPVGDIGPGYWCKGIKSGFRSRARAEHELTRDIETLIGTIAREAAAPFLDFHCPACSKAKIVRVLATAGKPALVMCDECGTRWPTMQAVLDDAVRHGHRLDPLTASAWELWDPYAYGSGYKDGRKAERQHAQNLIRALFPHPLYGVPKIEAWDAARNYLARPQTEGRRDAPTTEVPDSRRSDPDARDSANPAPRDQDQ
jgi:predicted RNA-binding Zn-ribbon protein involved in translation (DUF1610 family)